MYRLYGIPARYATGYALSPSDFNKKKGAAAALGALLPAIVWTWLYIRYKRREQWIKKGGIGRAFDQLVFDLHYAGKNVCFTISGFL